MTLLGKAYKEKTGRVLKMNAMVLDSTPGRATYAATLRAFSLGLPKNPIVHFIGMIFMRLVFVLYKLQFILRGTVDLVDSLRVDLKDKEIYNLEAKRCHIYSVKDDMVQWQFVEEHAQEARELGYDVQIERFGESGHCGHLLLDPERYWSIVQKLWREGA